MHLFISIHHIKKDNQVDDNDMSSSCGNKDTIKHQICLRCQGQLKIIKNLCHKKVRTRQDMSDALGI